jgi:hypothetical protein
VQSLLRISLNRPVQPACSLALDFAGVDRSLLPVAWHHHTDRALSDIRGPISEHVMKLCHYLTIFANKKVGAAFVPERLVALILTSSLLLSFTT